MTESSSFKSQIIWPVLILSCLVVTAVGFDYDRPVATWVVCYFGLIMILLMLERRLPFEKKWQNSDGQSWNDIGHTLVCKGTVQGLAIFGGAVGATAWVQPVLVGGQTLWPTTWPMFGQVLLALLVYEFVLYWAHRLGHEWPLFWRFHALHHSAERLWVVNTGRFHFVESDLKVFGLFLAMGLLGMPLKTMYWFSAITSYVGLLTHCNVEMNNFYLSWFFNTPNLHRWHHSPRLNEGNKNYGENLMVWDHLFGTFFNPQRRPGIDIGLSEGQMPADFVSQLIWPFRKR